MAKSGHLALLCQVRTVLPMLNLYTPEFHLLFIVWWCFNIVKASGFVWEFKKQVHMEARVPLSIFCLFVFETSIEYQGFFTCSFECSREINPVLGWMTVSLNLVTMVDGHFPTNANTYFYVHSQKRSYACVPHDSCCLWAQVSRWGQTGCSPAVLQVWT